MDKHLQSVLNLIQQGKSLSADEKNTILKSLKEADNELEYKNRELEIESSLERVRTIAMSMNKPDDMLHVCRIISEQIQHLNVQEIRNVQTAIFYET